MCNPHLLIVWLGALATLGVYSILYRENPVSRLFEHIFVGLSVGYMVAVTWTETLRDKWYLPMIHDREWYWIFAPIIGLLFYFIFSRKLSWMARLAMGLFFGTAAGQTFRGFFPIFWPQVTGSFKPLRAHPATATMPGLTWGDAILHNWLFVIILLAVMSYFFFSIRPESGAGKVQTKTASLGRWFLMIAFGAMFGNTVMARLSLFIGRVDFLLHQWLGPTWVALWNHVLPLVYVLTHHHA